MAGAGEIEAPALRHAAQRDASLTRTFLVLDVAACAIATLGLLENSVAVIIGAMVVAPLISPIQAFAYGALAGDVPLARRAVLTAAAGAAVAIAVSAALGGAIGLPAAHTEILARTRPTLLDLGIAVVAGAVAGFARVRSDVANTVAGTAIAVALMPPLCVVGLALSLRQTSWATGAALLFGTNFLGIALACMVVFVVTRAVPRHSTLGLVTTALITAALLFPLGASFVEIVREDRIETAIRHALVSDTVTFRTVRLVAAHFDWYVKPIGVTLDVSAERTVSSDQVRDLQTFIAQRTGVPVQLRLRVRRYDTVTDAGASTGADGERGAAQSAPLPP